MNPTEEKLGKAKYQMLKPLISIFNLNSKEIEALGSIYKPTLEGLVDKMQNRATTKKEIPILVKDETGTANTLWYIWKTAAAKYGHMKIKRNVKYSIEVPGGVLLACLAKARLLYKNIEKTKEEVIE